MKRFVAVCAGSIALVTGAALAPVVATAATSHRTTTSAASHGAVSTARWASRIVTIPAPRKVNLKALSKSSGGQHPGLVAPFGHVKSGRTLVGGSDARRTGVRVVPATRQTSTGTVAPRGNQPAFAVPLMSLTQQVGLIGADQNLEPPDTQIAVGPTYLVEAVNDSLSVWSKGVSNALVTYADLNVFFPVPSGYSFSDPRLLYDAPSGRFILSGFSFDALNDSQTYLAVSATSDPTGSWTVYTVQGNTSNTITDQPMTGVCDDKVVMAWNDFTGAGATPAYDGVQALILQKSTLLAGTSLGSADSSLFTTPDEFRLVPAQALSSTATCWMTVNNASTDLPGSTSAPTLGVIAITGTPALGTVALAETDLPIAATNAPPAPVQMGTAVEPASSNDDRLLSAVWQNNMLWTSATDACTPPGDTTIRNCMRLDEVSTSGASPSVVQDFDASTPGLDEYYPAVSLDSSGDLFIAFSASSATQYAMACGVVSPASSVDAFAPPVYCQPGAGIYQGVSGSNRWGDYSSAAQDPSAPTMVWTAGEYARGDASSGDWGTAVESDNFGSVAGYPAITSADHSTFQVGAAGTFTVTATGSPAPTLTETGTLPAGVTFNGSTGVLSGTPAAGGSYPLQITAANGAGSVTQTFTLTVRAPTTTSTPAVLNYSNGTLALYTVRSDGNLWADAQSVSGGSFNGWKPLSAGDNFTGTPAVIETSSGIIGIYARTTSGAVMGASQSTPNAAPSTWSKIGAASGLVSDPDVLLTASGVIAIYASDSSGAMEGISQFSRNSAFGNWQVLSPNDGFSGRPSVIQTKSGVIAIYARTPAGMILGTSQHVVGGSFSSWGQLGAASGLVSDPTVLLTASGVIAVYAADSGGSIEGVSQFAAYSAFGNWQVIGSGFIGFAGRPAVLQTSSGVIAIYALNTGERILGTGQSAPGGAFSAWTPLGTASDPLVSDPAALITTSKVIAIYAADSSGGISGISQSVPLGPFGDWTQI